jgi:hypothetical protein
MADQTCFVTATARMLIEQCRRDIESARHHLEAAREMLRRSRPLLARWEEQRRTGFYIVKLPDIVPARAGMFLFVEPAVRSHRRRKARPGRGTRRTRATASDDKAPPLFATSARDGGKFRRPSPR